MFYLAVSIIGTVNTDTVGVLMSQGLSQALAGQFSVEGVSLPLEDKWVIIPSEQDEIKLATDAFNATIVATATEAGLGLCGFRNHNATIVLEEVIPLVILF